MNQSVLFSLTGGPIVRKHRVITLQSDWLNRSSYLPRNLKYSRQHAIYGYTGKKQEIWSTTKNLYEILTLNFLAGIYEFQANVMAENSDEVKD